MIRIKPTAEPQSIRTRCREHTPEEYLMIIDRGLEGVTAYAPEFEYQDGEITGMIEVIVDEGELLSTRFFSVVDSDFYNDILTDQPVKFTQDEWREAYEAFILTGMLNKEIYRGSFLVKEIINLDKHKSE